MDQFGWKLSELEHLLPSSLLHLLEHTIFEKHGTTPDCRYWKHSKTYQFTIPSANVILAPGLPWQGSLFGN